MLPGIGVFWALHTTWNRVVYLDGTVSLITRNRVWQELHVDACKIHTRQRLIDECTVCIMDPPCGCFPVTGRSGVLQVGQ